MLMKLDNNSAFPFRMQSHSSDFLIRDEIPSHHEVILFHSPLIEVIFARALRKQVAHSSKFNFWVKIKNGETNLKGISVSFMNCNCNWIVSRFFAILWQKK